MKEETAENEQRKNNGVVKKTQRALRHKVSQQKQKSKEGKMEQKNVRELGRQKTEER